jgi:hypothetical protein
LHVIAAPVVSLVLLLGLDSAAAINRCEGRDGRVTYTDEPCPTTARSSRKVDDSPPVLSRDVPGQTAKDPAEAKASAMPESKEAESKSAPQGGAEAAKAAPAALQLQPGRITASSNPEQEMQRLDELRVRQQRQCAEANRRIDYATKDLQAAIGADRASAELALRRLQEEARTVCPPR